MYSNHKNINLLTVLLERHGVSNVVVCPGSRNAPIVHNLCACASFRCFAVTDERSAGFFALGLAQATGNAVAVCVTSGTAVVNLFPAMAEAYYQHQKVVVISADRPEAWIGQLDGQTMPQRDVFGKLVNKSVSLPGKIDDDTSHWLCNRLVNEALLAASYPVAGPVHINVPVEEPLFEFSEADLPDERVVRRVACPATGAADVVARALTSARRPVVVVGQHRFSHDGRKEWQKAWHFIDTHAVVLSERLSDGIDRKVHFDEVLAAVGDDVRLKPDFVLYIGGTLVSKRLRQWLRRIDGLEAMMLGVGDQLCDVTTHLTSLVSADVDDVLRSLDDIAGVGMMDDKAFPEEKSTFLSRWKNLLRRAGEVVEDHEPPYSQMAVVRYFEQQLEDLEEDCHVHYANSSPVRLANIYSERPVWCNRGVNGIDGSLSTAAGFAAAVKGKVFCIVGDLSFFYDQNALWNQNVGGNLRIILLNNGGGGIFKMLKGLEQSAAAGIACGQHASSAKGICLQNDVGYLAAHDTDEMRVGMVTLLTKNTSRPMVLEVFTGQEDDAAALGAYYQKQIQILQQYSTRL